jgi:hypothetical protein
LILWIGVRLAMRRPLAHPWLASIVLSGLSATAGSYSETFLGPGEHVAYGLAALLGFAGLVVFGEGLKAELGVSRSTDRHIVLIAATCLVLGIVCGLLSTPRDHLIGDMAGSAYLLSLLGILLSARQRRAGSALIAAAIVTYAFTRTLLLGIRTRGVDSYRMEHAFDLTVILVFGLGLIVFAIEGALKPVRTRW